jgi:hypothetical protein
MTTLSLLNDDDIGTVYLQIFPDNSKRLLKYMGDTVRQTDGQPLKDFKRLNASVSYHYLPNDESFVLEKMPKLPDDAFEPNDTWLNISKFLGNDKGGKRKSRKRRSRRRKLTNKRR